MSSPMLNIVIKNNNNNKNHCVLHLKKGTIGNYCISKKQHKLLTPPVLTDNMKLKQRMASYLNKQTTKWLPNISTIFA